jgi:hypothetical protein
MPPGKLPARVPIVSLFAAAPGLVKNLLSKFPSTKILQQEKYPPHASKLF